MTTLLDAALDRVADLAERSQQHWRVEPARAQLNTSLPMDVLHGQTVLGVFKQLTVLALVYHLVRLVMRQSATLQQTAVERMSFLDALRWLREPRTGMPFAALMVNPQL